MAGSVDCNDGEPILYSAAKIGDVELVAKLIEQGVDLNEANELGESPLWIATSMDHVKVIEILVANGADISQQDFQNGATPIDVAAFNGDLEILKLMLEKGKLDKESKIKLRDLSLIWAAHGGHNQTVLYLISEKAYVNVTNIHKTSPILKATFYGHLGIMTILITNNANVEQADKFRWRSIHAATYRGDLKAMKLLVEEGNAKVNVKTRARDTPLHLVGSYEHTAEYLISKGANVNEINRHRENPLFNLLHYRNIVAMKVLIGNGANVDQTNGNTWRLIHVASDIGYLEELKILVEIGGADINAMTETGETALSLAAVKGHTNILQYLIDQGANVNPTNEHERVPLLRATLHKQSESIKVLMENGANLTSYVYGKRAIHMAAISGSLDIFKLLVEVYGADIGAKTLHGLTPLHFAAKYGHSDICQYLIKNGAGVNVTNDAGESPLWFAALLGHANATLIKYLVDNGADVKQANNMNWQPLHAAAYRGNLIAIQFFIEEGKVNVSSTTSDGETPLLLASKEDNEEVIEYLIGKGANVNEADKDGKSPLWVASKYDNVNAMRMLIKNDADVEQANHVGGRPIHIAAFKGFLNAVKLLIEEGNADVNAETDKGLTALALARHEHHRNVVNYLIEKGAN